MDLEFVKYLLFDIKFTPIQVSRMLEVYYPDFISELMANNIYPDVNHLKSRLRVDDLYRMIEQEKMSYHAIERETGIDRKTIKDREKRKNYKEYKKHFPEQFCYYVGEPYDAKKHHNSSRKTDKDAEIASKNSHMRREMLLTEITNYNNSEKASFLFSQYMESCTSRLYVPTREQVVNFVNFFYDDYTFNRIYDEWIEFGEGKDSHLKPSIDHIVPYCSFKGVDVSKAWEVENLEYMTWEENRLKNSCTPQLYFEHMAINFGPVAKQFQEERHPRLVQFINEHSPSLYGGDFLLSDEDICS